MEEYICDKCGGRGVISITYEPIQIDSFGGMRQFVPGIGKEDVCRKCLGSGKLDWIENLFGKQPADAFDFIEIPKLNVPFPQLTSKDIISEQPMKEPVLNTSFIKIKVSEF